MKSLDELEPTVEPPTRTLLGNWEVAWSQSRFQKFLQEHAAKEPIDKHVVPRYTLGGVE